VTDTQARLGEPIYADPYTRMAWLRAELERVTAALREIVEQDPVENALDPQWSARIASDALTDVARAAQEDK
jgi:hypothetical protein